MLLTHYTLRSELLSMAMDNAAPTNTDKEQKKKKKKKKKKRKQRKKTHGTNRNKTVLITMMLIERNCYRCRTALPLQTATGYAPRR